MTYSTGFLVTVVAGAWLLSERDVAWRTKILAGGAIGLAGLLAVKGVFWIQDSQTHVAGAFGQAQMEFNNRGWSFPLVTVWRYARGIVARPGIIAVVPLVTLGMLVAIVAGIRGWRTWAGWERILLLHASVYWFFPLCVGSDPQPWRFGVTPWRPMALIAPVALLLRRGPIWLVWVVVALELAITALSVFLYGAGRLV